MPILVARHYTRADIRAHREWLYVFGDNVSTLGRGGQAKECRGEPNCVGIVTKWHPFTDAGSYFCDDDLPKVRLRIQDEFRRLAAHLRTGGIVVWPQDGVGTGLAELPTRAPRIHAFIDRCYQYLKDNAPPFEAVAQ
jgi:hypothetical protein